MLGMPRNGSSCSAGTAMAPWGAHGLGLSAPGAGLSMSGTEGYSTGQAPSAGIWWPTGVVPSSVRLASTLMPPPEAPLPPATAPTSAPVQSNGACITHPTHPMTESLARELEK